MRRPLILLLAFIALGLLATSCSAAPNPETAIRAVERTLVGLPTEHAVVFDRAGDMLAQFAGDADSVGISINGFAGDIMTHNHTADETFSTADVENAYKMGLYQLRVVQPSGTVCVMTAAPGHPFVDVELDDGEGTSIAPSGAYLYNWQLVWIIWSRRNGLYYGCSRL